MYKQKSGWVVRLSRFLLTHITVDVEFSHIENLHFDMSY